VDEDLLSLLGKVIEDYMKQRDELARQIERDGLDKRIQNAGAEIKSLYTVFTAEGWSERDRVMLGLEHLSKLARILDLPSPGREG
jgi:hypothetical protein